MSRYKAVIAVFLAGLALAGLDLGLSAFRQGEAVKAYNPDNLIRLHVIANSDDPADQALKRDVRDAIMAAMGPVFGQASSIDEARDLVRENLGRLQDITRDRIRAFGVDYDVQVELGRFPFPTRSYGNFALPAGEYEALRVVIGRGEGRNWWCVLFPPLCFVDFTAGVTVTNSALINPGEALPTLKVQEKAQDGDVSLLADVDPRELPLEVRLAVVDWLKRSHVNLAWLKNWLTW